MMRYDTRFDLDHKTIIQALSFGNHLDFFGQLRRGGRRALHDDP